MIREGEYFLHLCFQEGVNNVLVILNQKENICMGKGEKKKKVEAMRTVI